MKHDRLFHIPTGFERGRGIAPESGGGDCSSRDISCSLSSRVKFRIFGNFRTAATSPDRTTFGTTWMLSLGHDLKTREANISTRFRKRPEKSVAPVGPFPLSVPVHICFYNLGEASVELFFRRGATVRLEATLGERFQFFNASSDNLVGEPAGGIPAIT